MRPPASVIVLAAVLTACADAPKREADASAGPPAANAAAETPNQAARAIADLFRAGDFDALIRTRYAEIHKAPGEEQIEQLVERFRKRFGDDSARAEAIGIYEGLDSTTPELSEDGTVAAFPVGDGFVKLSRMADGRWGFHL